MGRRGRWAAAAVAAGAGLACGAALGAWWAARRARRAPGPRRRPRAPRESEGGAGGGDSEAARKAALLEHLRGGTWVRLGASAVEGVGVIAARDIPAGTDPFRACNAHLARPEEMVELTQAEVESLPPEVQALVRAFFAPLTDDNDVEWRGPDGGLLFGVNATGVSTLDASWYLNHSAAPNVAFRAADLEGGESFNTYVTLRPVKEGEELCVDYGDIGQVYLAETLRGRGGRGRREVGGPGGDSAGGAGRAGSGGPTLTASAPLASPLRPVAGRRYLKPARPRRE